MSHIVEDVIELTEFENHADPAELMELLRRRSALEGATGKARFWAATFGGSHSDRLLIATEFPSGMALAIARQDVESAAALRQWEADARKAGLSLKSRIGLMNLNPGDKAEESGATANGQPAILHFVEMNVNGKVAEFVKIFERAQEVIWKFGGKDSGIRRQWAIIWPGDHARNVVATVEYPNHAAQLRTIEDVDSRAEWFEVMGEFGKLQPQAAFEGVFTELLP